MPSSITSTVIFAALLLIVSLGMLTMHWNTWQAADHGGLPERERMFMQRQFRRRLNASAGIGLVGLLLISGLWIPEESLVNLVYLCGILLLVVWIFLLSLLDILATRLHYDRQQALQAAQIAVLQAAIKRELAKQADSASGNSANATDEN